MRWPLAFLLLAACDDGDNERFQPPKPVDTQAVTAWEIGPGSYSLGMPKHPAYHLEGFAFDFGPDAEPHYVTTRHGPLTGMARMRMSYRVEAYPDVRIYGKGCAVASPSAINLYFQRSGGLGGDGDRWWATFAKTELSQAGSYEIDAALDGGWTSVDTTPDTPQSFASAKADADRVGFTFANCEGQGHGARATGPVKFVVTSFKVE